MTYTKSFIQIISIKINHLIFNNITDKYLLTKIQLINYLIKLKTYKNCTFIK